MIFRNLVALGFSLRLLAGELLIIDASPLREPGMFACANVVLGHLHLYEMGAYSGFSELAVDFGQSGLYFDPDYGPNWWNYYFEPIHLQISALQNNASRFKDGSFAAIHARWQLKREQASALVKKYIHIQQSILEKAAQFIERHFQNVFVLGIHYRGTDKEKEAPRVPYAEAIGAVFAHIPSDQPYKIFVATDEAAFLSQMKKTFPGSVIAYDAHRSNGVMPVHLSQPPSPYAIGEEALLDALILSNCDFLIRTSSNLSLWSTYFNPELPVELLNCRYELHSFEAE
ncbi:MAG: hypothetical protein WCF19_04795 [Chlamydiales bacterium]